MQSFYQLIRLCGTWLLLGGATMAAAAEAPSAWYSCIVHVHTEMSSGRYSLPELTALARQRGVDAIFLTDSLTQSIEYGLPPWRHVLRANWQLPSVLHMGATDYLAAVARENARQRDVVFIAGVEVVPRFYWSGTWWRRDLVCHNHQRNLIVLGTGDAAVIKAIPETGAILAQRDLGWWLLTRAALLLLLVALVGLVVLPARLARRSPYNVGEIRLSYLVAALLPVLLVVSLVEFAAGRVQRFQIYGGADSPEQYEQAVLDYVQAHKLPHYWAHPEAVDHHDFKFASLGFVADTRPYPEVLLRTRGQAGFASVYEDTTTLTQPGGAWDTLLLEYCAGRRTAPAWGYGEMLYHYEGQAGKSLDNVETMVQAAAKQPEALLEALRQGHFYARRNAAAPRRAKLRLQNWQVGQASSGGTESCATATVALALAVDSEYDQEDVRVTIVGNGVVVRDLRQPTPIRLNLELPVAPDQRRGYYRATISGRHGLTLVTNPIFVTPAQAQE